MAAASQYPAIVSDPLDDALSKLDEQQLRAAGTDPEFAAGLIALKGSRVRRGKAGVFTQEQGQGSALVERSPSISSLGNAITT